MNTEIDYLRSIAEELKNNKSSSEIKPDPHLLIETRRLEKLIIHDLVSVENLNQRDCVYTSTLIKLVNICDVLFGIHQTVTPDVTVIIELLTAIKQVIPDEIRPNLKLPRAFISLQKRPISDSWKVQEKVMRKHAIDEKLIKVSTIPFRRFIEAKDTLYWGDYTWLKGYQAKLDILDWENADCSSPAEALMSLLIGRDFNDDRFYVYCKKYITGRTKAVAGKRQRMLAYAECERLVLQDTQTGMPSFDIHANSLSTRLIKWIREEIDFMETHERERPLSKFEFKWNVETIAFFFKLLWDHKVFGKVSLEPLSEQIAANCSSVGKDEFRATTIFSRFYVKDTEVLKAVEKVLAEMLEDVRRFL
jgi:hypothetical protein